jgi:hypothetical protein
MLFQETPYRPVAEKSGIKKFTDISKTADHIHRAAIHGAGDDHKRLSPPAARSRRSQWPPGKVDMIVTTATRR